MKRIIKWLLLAIVNLNASMVFAQMVNSKPEVSVQQIWNGEQGKKSDYIWAAKDAAGNVLQRYPQYRYFQQLKGTVYIVGKGKPETKYPYRKAEEFGLIDVVTAKELHPVNAYSIGNYNNCLVHIITKDKKHILLNTDGTAINSNVYDYATSPGPIYTYIKRQKFFYVRLNNKYGYIDSCGTLLTPIHFDEAQSFDDGKAIVKRNGKWTWLDSTMQEVLPPTFTYLKYFNNDIVPYSTAEGIETYPKFTGGKLGLINSKGQRITEEIYDDISFVNGVYNAKLNGQWITINSAASSLAATAAAPILYQEFHKKARFGYYKYGYKIGNDWLVKPVFDIAYEFNGNFAYVGNKGDDEVMTFGGNMAKAMEYGLLDRTGKLVIPIKYKGLQLFQPGLYGFTKGNGKSEWRQGIIDSTGTVVLPAEYTVLQAPSEGLLAAKKETSFGYIDLTGKEVIPFKYYSATSFKNGYACVATAPNSWYWINKKGIEIMPGKRFVSITDWDSSGKAWTWNKLDKWNRPDSALQITLNGTVVASRPLNSPPIPPPPGRPRCSLCGGSGYAYKTREVNSSYTNVEGMFAPVQKNTTYSYSYKVYEKNGGCTRCGGKGYE